MRLKRRLACAATALAALATVSVGGGGTSAWAQGPIKVAVLGVDPVRTKAALAGQIATAIKSRVGQTAGYMLVQSKSLDEIKLVFGCVAEKPACMSKVGRTLKAHKMIWGRLSRKGRRSQRYTLKLWVLDVATKQKKLLSKANMRADEVKDADALVAGLTKDVLVPAQGNIKLDCRAKGAEVLLGNVHKGTCDGSGTILIKGIPAGTHLLEVRKEGHQKWTKRVVVGAGLTVAMTVKLRAVGGGSGTTGSGGDKNPGVTPPTGGSDKKTSRTGWKVAFWTAAAVTAGLVAGIVVTGLSVGDIENDKQAQIQVVRGTLPGGDPRIQQLGNKDVNACDIAAADTSVAALKDLDDICSKGNTRATIVNALIGAAAVTGILSGFFLYRAYLRSEDKKKDDDDSSTAAVDGRALRQPVAPRWRLRSNIGRNNVRLGVSVEF